MRGELIDILEKDFMRFEKYVTYGIEDVYLLDEEVDPIRYCFFQDLYICREYYEDKIRNWIESGDGALGVITGVQGSGKSTMLKKVEQSVDADEFPFISINFRSFYQQMLSGHDPENWDKLVVSYIKEVLVERYFDKDRIFSFLPYFLYENNEMHNVFRDERDEIHVMYHSLNAGSVDSKIDECEWYKRNMFNEKILQITRNVVGKLSLEHYLVAAKKSGGGIIKKFIVIFDNVDRVPKDLQCYLYSIAEDVRSINMSTVQVIIATRKETSHPPDIVCNMSPAPIAEFGIISSIDSDKNKLMSEDFFEILSKRLGLYSKQNEGSEGSVLVEISRYLKHQYAEAVLINLANQSIRDALKYHCDFVRYLLEQYSSQELIEILKTEKCNSFLSSCLYSWITQYSTVLHNQCVNVVSLVSFCERNQYKNITGCDLTYLILVAIYNFKKRQYRNPSFTELVEKFRVLSYDNAAIKAALFNLWRIRTEDFGHIVTLYQYPMPKQPKDILDNIEVEINYRGESLIKQISITFSFINKLLFDDEDGDYYFSIYRSRVKKYHDVSSIPIHARASIGFFYRLAFLHTLELHKIRTRYMSDDWYAFYVRDFAIDKRLQLVRILRSNVAFLKSVIKARNIGISRDGLEDLRNICEEMQFLESLYENYALSFTVLNVDELQIFDYIKFGKDVFANGLDGYSLDALMKDKKYIYNIKDLL